MIYRSPLKGFTLIELSIVVVILGLIVAGIMGANTLTEQAKLRKVVKEVHQLNAAVRSFQLEYGALPGDLRNGYEFWGSECGVDNNPDLYSGSVGCNGSGSGLIESRTGSGSGNQGGPRIAWRHLKQAGYYDGVFNYTSPTAPATDTYLASAIGNDAVYSINSIGFEGGYRALGEGYFYQSSAIPRRIGLFISLGTIADHVAYIVDDLQVGVMSSTNAKAIDDKIDDGEPTAGAVVTTAGWNAGLYKCGPKYNGNDEVDYYRLNDPDPTCRMMFEMQ